jgi:zinc transport system ATP-binding protein
VFIARALASEPEVVLLDEPTIGIDQKARGEFYSLLRELNTQQKMTLVLVSHDLETVVAEAKHVAYVNTTLEFFGTSRNFLKDKHAQLMIRESTKTPHGKGHA